MLASISAIQAETKFSGDPSDTPVTLEQFGDLPGSSIPATSGNPDGYLLLTEVSTDKIISPLLTAPIQGQLQTRSSRLISSSNQMQLQAQTESRFLMPIPESTEPLVASVPRLLHLRIVQQLAYLVSDSIRGATRELLMIPTYRQAATIKKSVRFGMGI